MHGARSGKRMRTSTPYLRARKRGVLFADTISLRRSHATNVNAGWRWTVDFDADLLAILLVARDRELRARPSRGEGLRREARALSHDSCRRPCAYFIFSTAASTSSIGISPRGRVSRM